MHDEFARSLPNSPSQDKTVLRGKILPIVESRAKFEQVFSISGIQAVLLRHCNLFEFTALLKHAQQRTIQVYVNIDHIEGIAPDAAGLRFLAHQCHVTSIVSSNPRTLVLAKDLGLQTIQRVFAMDSTGLEATLETVDTQYVDLLDIAPAPVIPHIIPYLKSVLPAPFIGSGLLHTAQQVQAVLDAGAQKAAVMRSELWR